MIGKKTLQTQRNLFVPQRSHHSPLFEGESARQERSSQASRWGDIKRQNNLKFSRELRQNVTDVERILWYHLRNTQLGGYKFRDSPLENTLSILSV